MENMKWIVLGIAVAMYALVIAFQNKKVLFTLCAAVFIILLGMIYPDIVFPLPEDIVAMDVSYKSRIFALVHSFQDLINWNVLLIYIGSMIIASLFIYSNVPSLIASKIINSCSKSSFSLVLILLLTAVISIFVENVATLLVMAPIALSLCKKLNVNPKAFIVSLVLVSNIEGSATLIGDPTSMFLPVTQDLILMIFLCMTGGFQFFSSYKLHLFLDACCFILHTSVKKMSVSKFREKTLCHGFRLRFLL